MATEANNFLSRVGRWASWLAFAIFLSTAASCNRSTPSTADPDTKALENLVYDLPDLSRDRARFRGLFAASAVPTDAQRQEFGKYVLRLDEPPQVTGDEASLKVVVGDEHGERTLEWKAVKSGSQWQLTSAPLR